MRLEPPVPVILRTRLPSEILTIYGMRRILGYVQFLYGFLLGLVPIVALAIDWDSGLKGCGGHSLWDDLRLATWLFLHGGILSIPICLALGWVVWAVLKPVRADTFTLCLCIAVLFAVCGWFALNIVHAPCVTWSDL
jgi:hypothetical protein